MKSLDELYEEMLGAYDRNTSAYQLNLILEIMAIYHIRNGLMNTDGSMGSIHITPKEFKDVLAYAIERVSK